MKISVIVPALNEQELIAGTLTELRDNDHPDEILVVDGGSTDGTVGIASSVARVLVSPKGRARQMNEGARHAAGEILLFLHADTKLPVGGLASIREIFASGRAEAGRFRMRFDSDDPFLKLYSSYTRFHCFSYGDQAFFVSRRLFDKLGGFREDVPFEDMDFYKRLRRETRPVILKSPITTSARRFLKVGRLRQKWINLVLVTMYYLGFDVLPLKEKAYQDIR